MEEDKKKKKNKKKKNKQGKALEDSKVISGETTLSEQNHTSAFVSGQNDRTQISEGADVHISGALEADARDHSNGTKGANFDETEKRLWLQKEAMFEEKVKQLEIEKDSCIQREVVLEKKITDLQKEQDFWLQQEASMDQKLKEFVNEKANWTLKGANLEDRIKQLENDKESWILKENSTKETIDRLTKDYTEVQAQVKVLQESRDGLLQENQQLMERIAYLQSQPQHLEEESSFSASSTTKTEKVHHDNKDEDTNAQLEATDLLVEKLITVNAELVEKGPDPVPQISETIIVEKDMSEFREKMLNLGERVESPAIIQTTDEGAIDEGATSDHADTNPKKLQEINIKDSLGSYKAGGNEEIVQIPLDENEIQEVEVQDVNAEDKVVVPLTDAPLTGAPFRFITFVARYMSGADLVNKGNSDSGR